MSQGLVAAWWLGAPGAAGVEGVRPRGTEAAAAARAWTWLEAAVVALAWTGEAAVVALAWAGTEAAAVARAWTWLEAAVVALAWTGEAAVVALAWVGAEAFPAVGLTEAFATALPVNPTAGGAEAFTIACGAEAFTRWTARRAECRVAGHRL
ncbi:hypothetical protein ACTMTJ_11340 [Phytohabitans sp. LJ34]|uniref:hypothetical protein n=1 Tax=Phytohabitans sp. LJ34 TaxID=3452217 RepID=UPI003F8BB6A8